MASQQPNMAFSSSDYYCPSYHDEELEQLIHDCFDDVKLDQVIRCFASLMDSQNSDTFLMKIALSSPFPYSLLPGNRMRRRVEFIEDNILPPGFGCKLRTAMSLELFGDYNGEISLERFLHGVADCCRRDPRRALGIIWDCCSSHDHNMEYIVDQELDPAKLVDLCYRLSIAAEVIMSRDVHVLDAISAKLESEQKNCACSSLERPLAEAGRDGLVNRQNFFDWAETMEPNISSTMSIFVHNLLFHEEMPNDCTAFIFPTSIG